MINEEFFKKLEEGYIKRWYFGQEIAPEVLKLARELAKYTDNEEIVTRTLNGLRIADIHSIEDLMGADLVEVTFKIKNFVKPASIEIIRQIKEKDKDIYPFAKTYSVNFYDDATDSGWFKEFNTLKELTDYFKSDEFKYRAVIITDISEVEWKENNDDI